MGKVRFEISMSLDGYGAGPDPTDDEPLGKGGEQLHDWVVELEVWRKSHGRDGGEVNESTPVMEGQIANVGATVMGRGMFGGGPGPWGDDPWNGFWGDDPPYHHPVFVITHHEREPLTLSDTTFHFVTDGIESALDQAKGAAGDQDVKVAGGANVGNQCLAAGLLDEVELHVVPILLGGGARLLADLGDTDVRLEQNRVVEAPGVTHLRYAVRSR